MFRQIPKQFASRTSSVLVLALLLVFPHQAFTNQETVDPLSETDLDIRPPSYWVEGEIGAMTLQRAECRRFSGEELRQRIVDITLQQWEFFGSKQYVVRSAADEALPWQERRQRRPRLSEEESIRVAKSIAGYWSATAEGSWILPRQNERWEEDGNDARWQDAWSAAFISWVMCEAGIDDREQFRHAIAHHSYIDQAIRARDGNAPESLYVAYDSGEAEVAEGDLLCTGSRPLYLTLDQRRAHLGEGARTHCDIVVSVDKKANTIDTIGGNVQSAVTLKTLWINEQGQILSPIERAGRPVFAHLKLKK